MFLRFFSCICSRKIKTSTAKQNPQITTTAIVDECTVAAPNQQQSINSGNIQLGMLKEHTARHVMTLTSIWGLARKIKTRERRAESHGPTTNKYYYSKQETLISSNIQEPNQASKNIMNRSNIQVPRKFTSSR